MYRKFSWAPIVLLGILSPALGQDLPSAAPKPTVILGTDVTVNPPKTSYQPTEGAVTSLMFEDAPIGDVINVVLREILKVDFVLHPPVAGSVTLATRSAVSVDQAVFLLESALQGNGLAMARDSRGTYHIGRPEALKGIVPATRMVTKGPLPPGHGVMIAPLEFIGAAEMAAILRPLTPPDAIMRVDTVRNMLMLVGSRVQQEGWLDLINTFDVDMLKGMSVGVFPLQYASTKDVEAALRLIAGAAGAPQAAAAGAGSGTPTGGLTSGAPASPLATGGASPFLGSLRVFPLERQNSLLVVSPKASHLEEARVWIEKLDKPGNSGSEAQLFVYPVQNGSAKHLAQVLGGLFGTAGAVQPSTNTGVAPGLTPVSASTTGLGAGVAVGANAFKSAGANTGSVGTPQGGVVSVAVSQSTRLMADEINNAVLVYGTRAEFQKIESALKRLDVPPTQVLIEASIIEVTLSDDLKYGLQWMFSDSARSGLTGTGILANSSGGLSGTVTQGFSYTLRNSLGNVRAVLSALAEKSLVKVISSPSLMVLDNHVASINVGNQQPIRSAETVTTTGTSTSIQYKDTGVSLSVTPSVNAGNMVTMQLQQAVTDVGQIDSATGQRSFLQRQIASKVAVRSGETLVLGGLIRDNTTTGKSGLPLLQDLPLLGNLFGTNSSNTARTELLVVITPRVVRTDEDLRELAADLRRRMSDQFPSSSFTGLSDPK